MPNPPQAAFLEALGWTILNSWWQFGLLWILLLFLKKVLPKGSAALRYNLSLTMLLAGLGVTGISLFLRWNSLSDGIRPVILLNHNTIQSWYQTATNWLCLAIPYISIIYLVFLSFYVLRFSRLLQLSLQLKAGHLQKAPVDWRLFLQEMGANMNIKKSVQLWVSEKIDTPLLLGWLKPVILLPASAISNLAPDQLEAIIIHELAHIKRNDYFWNMVVAIAEVLLFFNPFARWIISEIRVERENSCDDWVLQFPYRPEQYAHALLHLEHQRIGKQSQLLLAARGSSRHLLLFRVKRMLNVPVSNKDNQGQLALMAILAVFLCLVAFFEPRQEIVSLLEKAIRVPSMQAESVAALNTAPESGKDITYTIRAAKGVKNPGTLKLQINPLPASIEEPNQEELVDLLAVDQQLNKPGEKALPAILTESRAYSLIEDQPMDVSIRSGLPAQPYIPRSSFQALNQQDSIIPQDVLNSKLLALQEKEAELQEKIALVQAKWEKFQQEKMANAELKNQFNLKKSELETIQNGVELKARQFEELIEKQSKMLQEQLQKLPRKRKVVHI